MSGDTSSLSQTDRYRSMIQNIIGITAFALLTAIAAQIRVPLPNTPVPMTLQTLVVIVSGTMLGPNRGALSQLLYIVVGVAGVPVFSNLGAGPSYLFGSTAGYLLGFCLASYVAGAVVQMPNRNRLFMTALASVLATAIIFVCGLAWLAVQLDSLTKAIDVGLLPFLLGAVIKCSLATGLTVMCRRDGTGAS